MSFENRKMNEDEQASLRTNEEEEKSQLDNSAEEKSQPSVVLEKLILADDPIRRLLLQIHNQKISQIINKFADGKITISPDQRHGSDVLVVTSVSPENLDSVFDYLNDLIAQVKDKEHQLLNERILTDSGKSFLMDVEPKHKVVVELDDSKPAQAPGQADAPSQEPGIQDNEDEGKFVLGMVTVEVLQGDLTKQNVNAIVNSTTSTLECQGGVFTSIIRNGGDEIKEECDKIVRDNGAIDCVVHTGSGRLRCGCILHLDTFSKGSWEERLIFVLEYARDNKMTSIAFPTFGTGEMNRIPSNQIAKEMYYAFKRFAGGDTGSVSNIRVVGYEKKHADDFVRFMGEAHRGDNGNGTIIAPVFSEVPGESGQIPLNNVTLTISQGDLTKCQTDAIVNGTNSVFVDAGKVTQAIFKAGGPDIKAECTSIGKFHKVIITKSGRLPCMAVIHLDTQDKRRNWTDRIYDVLHLAEEKKFRSVAFPAFGTGTVVTISDITQHMYRGIRGFAKDNPASRVTEVQIVAFDHKVKDKFEREICELHESLPPLSNKPAKSTAAAPVAMATHTITLYALSQEAIDNAISDIENFSEEACRDTERGQEEGDRGESKGQEADPLLGADSGPPLV